MQKVTPVTEIYLMREDEMQLKNLESCVIYPGYNKKKKKIFKLKILL